MDMQIAFTATNFRPPNLDHYSPASYRGDSPARRDLIAGRLPRGKLVLLAGQGDVGKSWLLLQLFEAVTLGEGHVFGGHVVGGAQPCLLLMGEDDREQIDLRLKVIRQSSGHTGASSLGAILPAPNICYMPLVLRDYVNQIQPTDVLQWVTETLTAWKAVHGSLGFVGIDTFSTLCPVDANKAEEVQAVWAHLAHLAAQLDVTVIVTHHLNKSGGGDLRSSIRGSTALVDGSRAAYVMAKLDPAAADPIREGVGLGCDGEVVQLKLVKNNLGLSGKPVTLVRLPNGMLQDVTDAIADDISPESALLEIILTLNKKGVQVTKSGTKGIHQMRSTAWPKVLNGMGRDALAMCVQGLIDSGRLTQDKGQRLIVV